MVYYTRKGVQCVRALPKDGQHEPSMAQLAQRLRMKVVTQHLSPLAPMLNDTFRPLDKKLTGMNKAVRYALQAEAVGGTYPDLHILPEKVLVSSGGVQKMRNPALGMDGPGIVALTWQGVSIYDDDDLAYILLYNVSNGRVQLAGGDTYRTAMRLSVELGEEMGQGTTYCYGFMMDRLRKSASDSVFVATLVDGAL